jgi:hypothetical protein
MHRAHGLACRLQPKERLADRAVTLPGSSTTLIAGTGQTWFIADLCDYAGINDPIGDARTGAS